MWILRYEILNKYLFTQLTDLMVLIGFVPHQAATVLCWMIRVATLVEIILMCIWSAIVFHWVLSCSRKRFFDKKWKNNSLQTRLNLQRF